MKEPLLGTVKVRFGGRISKKTSLIGLTIALLPALSKASIETSYRTPSASCEV